MANPLAFNWIGGGTPPASLFGVQPPVAPTMPGQPPVAWDWMRHPAGPPQTSPWATPDLAALFSGMFGQPTAPTAPPPAAPAPRQWRAGTPITNTFSGPVGQNYWDGNRFVIAGPPDPAPPAPPPAPAAGGQAPQQPAPPTGGSPGTGQTPSPIGGDGGGGGYGAGYAPGGGNVPGPGVDGGWNPTGGQSPFGGGFSLPGLGGIFGTQPAPGGLQSNGIPSMGQGWGTGLGLAGTVAGLGLGIPGLGILGSLAGTGIDITNANSAIRDVNARKGSDINSLGLDAFLGAMLNNATLGILGTSIRDAALASMERNGWNSVISTGGLNPDGSFTKSGSLVPGNSSPLSRDAGWAAAVDAKAGGGYWGRDSAWDGKAGGYGPVGPKEDSGGFNGTEQGSAKDGSEPGGGAESGKGNDGKYFKGGTVTRGHLPIDPPGPDDVVIGAQTGEGIVTREAMQKYPGLLGAMNAGALNAREVRGLLGGKQIRDTPDRGDPQERRPEDRPPPGIFGARARDEWYRRTEPRSRYPLSDGGFPVPPLLQPRLRFEMNDGAARR